MTCSFRMVGPTNAKGVGQWVPRVVRGREGAWCPGEDRASPRNVEQSTGKDSVVASKWKTGGGSHMRGKVHLGREGGVTDT